SGALSAVLLLQVLLELAEGRLWLVTRLAQPVGGALSEAGILQTPLWGIGKSIALEEPGRWGGLVDLDAEPAERSAQQLAEELVNPVGPEHEDHVAIREGRRLVARIHPTPAPAGQGVVLAPNATYLVSGGLGALGRALATRMVAKGARNLVLLSRTGASTEDRRAAIRALEAAGATVITPAVDVCD